MRFSKIAVLGLGKVGTLAAKLLHESGFDGHRPRRQPAPRGRCPSRWTRRIWPRPRHCASGIGGVEAVLSCLPYHLNLRSRDGRARARHALLRPDRGRADDAGDHRARRDRPRARWRRNAAWRRASSASSARACRQRLRDSAARCGMRVGALPQNPTGLLGYAFNWSPEGVVNEYLNDCEVIEEGVRKMGLADGMDGDDLRRQACKLEAFTTSGGLGTICETFHGKVANIDYKTMRYPGHAELMNFFFHELLMRERRELAGEILTYAKPPVDDDVVYVHVAAEGTRDGRLQRDEFVRAYCPLRARRGRAHRDRLDHLGLGRRGDRAGARRPPAAARLPAPGAHPARAVPGHPHRPAVRPGRARRAIDRLPAATHLAAAIEDRERAPCRCRSRTRKRSPSAAASSRRCGRSCRAKV